MGCSICLETYEDDADKGRKPVALPCGHIFHRACSDSWLKSCRNRSDPPCCPLCKYPMGLAKAQSLYPGDVNDLDTYLANRNRRVAHQRGEHGTRATSSANALDRHMTKEAQGNLLESLMDFRQHISGYVMSVNEVVMPTRGVEQQTFRLFKKATKSDKERQSMFHDSLAALTSATSVLNQTISASEEMRRDIERKQSAILLETDLLEQKKRRIDKHYATKDKEEQAMHETRERVKRLEMHLKKELSDVAREREKMESERRSYMQEAREKEHEAMKARLESAHILAQKEGDVKLEIERMKNYVYQQETLRIQAEDQAREAKGKSSLLADRNKLLSDKLATSRAEVKRLKASGGNSSSSNSNNSIMAQAASSVKAEKEEGPWNFLDSAKGKSRHTSQAPSQAQWDDDGFVEVGYRAGTRRQHDDTLLDYPSTSHGSAKKRSRYSEEQDDNGVLIIDSDNEGLDFDDNNYPMPGFQLYDRSAKPASRAALESLPAQGGGDDSVEIIGDNMGTSRNGAAEHSSVNAGLIQSILSARNLSFGPRQRAR